MKPKLIWHSNAPYSPTGYGQQTALFARGLAEHYGLAISCFYGLEGNVIPWHGIPLLPGIGQTYGNEAILDHAARIFEKDLRGGLVGTLLDVWVLEPKIWGQLNTFCWVPIDHDPAPDPIVRFFQESGAVPVAMSRFGEERLRAADLDPLYVPHAVDTETYGPIPKAEAREATKIPKNAFVVGMVAANKGNPSRKCFAEAFQAFKRLHDQHKEAVLYLHTEITGKFDGVNIPRLIDAIGLDRKAVVFCDQYRAVHLPFDPATMAKIYSSFDVLLMPSAGEGFGIPLVEAQACGVPAIVSDFSSQPELLGAGWKVEGRRVYTPINSYQFLPDPDSIHDALLLAYALSADERAKLAAKARDKARLYDIQTVLDDFMLPAIEEVRERYGVPAEETEAVAA